MNVDRRHLSTRARRAALVVAAGVVLSVGLSVGLAAPAAAHVTISPSTTAAGEVAVLRVAVEHGCEDSATTEVAIRLPSGISEAAPAPHPLWEAETVPAPEGSTSVVFRADRPVPDGQAIELELEVRLPETGGTLVFPTVQTCESGELAWLETAPDGTDPERLELPAPTVVVTEADADGRSTTSLAVGVLGAGVLGTAVVGGVLARQRRRP